MVTIDLYNMYQREPIRHLDAIIGKDPSRVQNTNPPTQDLNIDDDVDTAIKRKRDKIKDTIKNVDQSKTYLHGAYKFHYEKNKYKKRSHPLNSHT